MKTNVFFKAVVMVAVVMASVMLSLIHICMQWELPIVEGL